jgi:ribonuclease J
LGGAGEIGMNLYIYETDDSALIVDCGVMFGDDYLPAVDVILPDFAYLETIRHKLKGVLATHGHEDHIGGISRLLSFINIPVYTGKFTYELLALKAKAHTSKLNLITLFNPYSFGDIKAVFFPVQHSIPDTCGVALEIEGKRIVHMSDFVSLDIPDFLKNEDIFLLMLDSTNSIHSGDDSQNGYYQVNTESDVAVELADIIKTAPGKVFFTTFASNVDRLASVMDAAELSGRKVVIIGSAMEKTIEITSKLSLIKRIDERLISIKDAAEYPPEKLVYILSGCQGEYNSALYSVIKKERKSVTMDEGDTLILSSRVIPGNERWINNIVNRAVKDGVTVIQSVDRLVHVSGHAAADELGRVISEFKPKYFIPIHGEYRHMKACAAIALRDGASVHIMESGAILDFSENDVKKSSFPIVPVFIDNYGETFNKSVLDELNHISREGLIVITKKGRGYSAKPIGLMLSKNFMKWLCAAVAGIQNPEEAVRQVKKLVKNRSGRKPLVVLL